MRMFRGTARSIAALFLVGCAIEIAFVFLYYYESHGPLISAIKEHTETLQKGTIPDAAQIDIYRDNWTHVARFEEVFSELQLVVAPLFAILMTWVFLWRGVSIAIRDFVSKKAENVHVRRMLYIGAIVVVGAVMALPESFSEYFIGHMRGTLVAGPADATWNIGMGFLISLIETLVLFVSLYWIIDRFKNRWWIMAAVFVSLFFILTAFIDPVVVEPLFVDSEPLQDSALRSEIVEMTQRAGVPIERIYVSNASAQTLESNAAVSGIGWTKRIELDDTMIAHYTHREILFVVAHELGHYVHHDILLDIVISTLYAFFSYRLLALSFRFFIKRYGKAVDITKENDIALFPLIGFVFVALGFLTSPLLSAISRSVEHRADEYALALTHDAPAGIDGFKKLAFESFVDPTPPVFLHLWFDDHPSIQERLNFLAQTK